jgi:fatty-acyl-CoA synthase
MWEEFIDMGIQIDYHELKRTNTLSFDDPIIQFTSGTTRSKRTTLSHHNILNNGYIA